MSTDQNLIVNMTVNPPYITIIGPIRENTIEKLNASLPSMCTTVATDKAKLSFIYKDTPSHWYGSLPMCFADVEVGQSMIILFILDTLEGEGWRLKGSNCVSHDGDKVTSKYFFSRAV
eukprot:Tbor_TRINITY_DN5401_c4_g1::TRINITY_DN5401_c4_g1_i1::g.24285::m.24285